MTTDTELAPTQSRVDIAALGTAFCSAKILLSALELGLFTELAAGPATETELRERLGLHPRATRDFFTALVALGLLERDGDRYRNSAAAQQDLVRGPGYQGGFLEGANFVLYPTWGRLTDALRTGAPQAMGDLGELLRDPAMREGYLAMQDGLSAPFAPSIDAAVDWTGYQTLLDIGGARGNLAGLLLRARPHLRGWVFDQPQNEQSCTEHAARLGVADRLRFRGGDFFTDALPETDVAVIGHVLADFDQDERRTLVAQAFLAIRPGGTFVVYDPMVDEHHPDLPALVNSLHMLVMTPGGAAYAPGECVGWLTEAGFTDVSARPVGVGNTMVVGHKNR
ncbi:MAG TPA: methyltransferase [Pseudonocardiaceae bacterium]|jgi:SAM-dependent methyltransferase|nr:methyltransferase [Pseudonocardiaceae bacterium]